MVSRSAALSVVSALGLAFGLALGLALGLGLAAAPAHADSAHLAEARRAIEVVDYEAARHLLVEALDDGDNSPAAMREIYRLSARAAVVLDQRELAEQYYRRWLAIDPDAALPDDTAPKLREPFVAAQAYIAAHGRLRATARRTAHGEIDVELIADPLAMAHAAAVAPAGSGAVAPAAAPSAPVVFGAERRARLAAGARIAILDERGNHLVELDPEPVAIAAPPAPAGRDDEASPPWTRRWLTWAIPTGAFALGAAGFGIAAIASYAHAHTITENSGQYHLSDAQDNVARGRLFVWITIGAGAATAACAIPAAIYLARDHRHPRVVVAPTVAPGGLGLLLTGRF
jgi:hypothetical protein